MITNSYNWSWQAYHVDHVLLQDVPLPVQPVQYIVCLTTLTVMSKSSYILLMQPFPIQPVCLNWTHSNINNNSHRLPTSTDRAVAEQGHNYYMLYIASPSSLSPAQQLVRTAVCIMNPELGEVH